MQGNLKRIQWLEGVSLHGQTAMCIAAASPRAVSKGSDVCDGKMVKAFTVYLKTIKEPAKGL